MLKWSLTLKSIIPSILFIFMIFVMVTGSLTGRRLVFTDLTITSEMTPVGLRGQTIAVLSDLHGHLPEYQFQELLIGLKSAKPVAILLPGDMIDSRTKLWPEARSLLEALPEIAPTYYSYGNHEIVNLRDHALDWLHELDITILRNGSSALQVGSEEILISGLDDRIHAYSERDYFLTMQRLRNTDTYQILLSHRPEYAEDYQALGFDLVVSGHAHGGQVILPLLGAIYSPHQGLFPKLTGGLYDLEDTKLVVSRGLGNRIPFPRLFNPKEVVLIHFE
jgi:hypothetical protein